MALPVLVETHDQIAEIDLEAELYAHRKAQEDAEATARAMGLKLHGEYIRRKGERQEIERRWLTDIEHYNGVYSKEYYEVLRDRKYASKVFVPTPRRVCNIVEARVGDLTFPTDDRNFVVETSPVPDLVEAEGLTSQLAPDHPVNVGGAQIPAGVVGDSVREMRDEAKRKAANMQRAIDDQLSEAKWSTVARRIIHDAVKLGTGIAKGPVVLGRMKKSWKAEGNVYQLSIAEDLSATVCRVDPWNFYPDLSASSVDECDSFYELHRMNKSRLAKLAKQPGFNPEAIARILEVGSQRNTDSTVAERREASGTSTVRDDRWNIVEYTGPIDTADLIACGVRVPDDPLAVYDAVVWFSEATGEPIKAIINPLDTDAQPYSVFNWQPDSASIFGYGLPYELRDLTEAANASFRAALDNMGLTSGPQIVVNESKIEPMNGQWVIEPHKLWKSTDPQQPVGNVFGFYQIDSRVQDLVAVFNLAKGLAEEIGGPAMAMQGTEAPSYVQAGATGMAIAYNAANIWMRRAVKLWDDQITTPLIGRFIDWNMQYNPDPEVKGDVFAQARGTAGLLEAEGQVSKISTLIEMSSKAGIPVRKMVNQLRQMALAMRLDPDDLLPNEAEVKQMEQQQAQNGPPPNPEQERIQIRQQELADRQAERDHAAKLAEANNQIRLAELAQKESLTIEQTKQKYGFEAQKANADLADRAAQRAHDAQKFNAEMVTKRQFGSGI